MYDIHDFSHSKEWLLEVMFLICNLHSTLSHIFCTNFFFGGGVGGGNQQLSNWPPTVHSLDHRHSNMGDCSIYSRDIISTFSNFVST